MISSFLDNHLEDFLAAVLQAHSNGISPLRNASQDLNWSFAQAILFTTSVVTTIGKSMPYLPTLLSKEIHVHEFHP